MVQQYDAAMHAMHTCALAHAPAALPVTAAPMLVTVRSMVPVATAAVALHSLLVSLQPGTAATPAAAVGPPALSLALVPALASVPVPVPVPVVAVAAVAAAGRRADLRVVRPAAKSAASIRTTRHGALSPLARPCRRCGSVTVTAAAAAAPVLLFRPPAIVPPAARTVLRVALSRPVLLLLAAARLAAVALRPLAARPPSIAARAAAALGIQGRGIRAGIRRAAAALPVPLVGVRPRLLLLPAPAPALAMLAFGSVGAPLLAPDAGAAVPTRTRHRGRPRPAALPVAVTVAVALSLLRGLPAGLHKVGAKGVVGGRPAQVVHTRVWCLRLCCGGRHRSNGEALPMPVPQTSWHGMGVTEHARGMSR